MFIISVVRLQPSSDLNNVYIKHPVSLEQYIMEGSYNKVLSLKGNVPAESYNFFFEILLNAVREEIASCVEKVMILTVTSHFIFLSRLTKPSAVLTPAEC